MNARCESLEFCQQTVMKGSVYIILRNATWTIICVLCFKVFTSRVSVSATGVPLYVHLCHSKTRDINMYYVIILFKLHQPGSSTLSNHFHHQAA